MLTERRESAVLWGVAAVVLAGIVAYSQTIALAWDEGFHLLTAQLILRGKRPYLDFLHPQAPLYGYFNAVLMRVFGESWRMVHVVSSLALVGAGLLTAGYVFERMFDGVLDKSWRLAAALCALALVLLNSTELWFGTIAQPYAVCLFLIMAAFRLTVRAAERDSTADAAVAGLCAGAAAACSLLTAPVAPVLLVWTWFGRKRWQQCLAFAAAAVVPSAPLAALFIQSPRQVLFGVFQYHALYRDADWPGAGKQNLDVATAWMNNYEAVLLIGLAGLGLTYIFGKVNFEAGRKRELLLCVWLIAVESAYLLIPRPTFGRYYLFVIPFLAILASMGMYAIASQVGSLRMPLRYPAILGVIMLAAFVKYSADAITDYRWSNLVPVAQKVQEVTPPEARLYADEQIYFLLRRIPPSGMEYADSHKLQLPAEKAAEMHVVPVATLDKEIDDGDFATIAICNNQDRVDALKLPLRYQQSADISGCKIYWDWK